ncbi:MAG: hypothetical protein LBD93_10970 [Treponema sp.]|nr:hypothetical protein [Treponema sp.]
MEQYFQRGDSVGIDVREDWSTYHTYFFDTATGSPIRENTAQGFYGNALSYRYLREPGLLEQKRRTAYRRCTGNFLHHSGNA